MLGAIIGDVIGSVHEGRSPGLKDFPLFTSRSCFTDDTVLTVAVASAILDGRDYKTAIRDWGLRYPTAGYGHGFYTWLTGPDMGPYNSFGNGSAMRVSPIGWAFNDGGEIDRHAIQSAFVSHNHPEGIKGAQAIAGVIGGLRVGGSKELTASWLLKTFGYDCSLTLEQLRERGGVGVTCQETVPAAVCAFLWSTDFEDAIRNAVSLGGDTDTTASIAGALAEAHYGGVPNEIAKEAVRRLDRPLFNVFNRFWLR
jgi:ADP-ribosylglycohydrolase